MMPPTLDSRVRSKTKLLSGRVAPGKQAVLLTLLPLSRIHHLVGEGLLSDSIAATVAGLLGLIAVIQLTGVRRNGRIAPFTTAQFVFALFACSIVLDIASLTFGFLLGSISVAVFAKNVIWWSTVWVMATAIILRADNAEKAQRYFACILASGILYLALNVVLASAGIQATRFEAVYGYLPQNSILKVLGFRAYLPYYPMSAGLKSMSTVSGTVAVLFLSLAMYNRSVRRRLLMSVCGLFAFCVTVSVDSRMAVMSAVVVLIVGKLFLSLRIHKVLRWAPLLIPMAALILPVLAGRVSTIRAAVILARAGDTANIASLSGRTDVWDTVLTEFSNPKAVHLVGYGAYGQRQSGLGEKYSHAFEGREDDISSKSAHNAALQILVDRGYGGLILFVLLQLALLRNLTREMSAQRYALMNALLFMYLVGTTQVLPYYSPADHYALYLMMVALGCSPFLGREAMGFRGFAARSGYDVGPASHALAFGGRDA